MTVGTDPVTSPVDWAARLPGLDGIILLYSHICTYSLLPF